jgi:hypothetical protein
MSTTTETAFGITDGRREILEHSLGVTEAGNALAFPGVRPPLVYCATCDQRRRGSKADRSLCSHCRRPLF